MIYDTQSIISKVRQSNLLFRMTFGGKSFHEKLSGMRPYELGDVNKLAGIGFFLSLIGAEVMGLILYCGQKNYGSFIFALPYVVIVPLIQLTGLVSSLKSIPYVEEWGDKDYAQGGLFDLFCWLGMDSELVIDY